MISTLELDDFRSFRRARVRLEPGATLVLGPNGTGKTSLLEGIFTALVGKSFRTERAAPLLRDGAASFAVHAEGRSPDGDEKWTRTVVGAPDRAGRLTPRRRLGGAGRTLAEFALGDGVPLVFSPEDALLPAATPAARRRHFDLALAAIRPGFLARLLEFRGVLTRRNALLRAGRPDGEFSFWDGKIARIGGEICAARADFGKKLAEILPDKLKIFDEKSTEFFYRPGLSAGAPAAGILTDEPTAEDFAKKIAQSLEIDRARDRARGSTSSGPHRDDWIFARDGAPLGERGSRGELRAVTLAVIFCQKDLAREAGAEPILLLDDLFAEFDPRHEAAVFELLGGVQAVLTAPRNITIPEKFQAEIAEISTADLSSE